MHIRGYEVAKFFLPQVVLLLDIELDTDFCEVSYLIMYYKCSEIVTRLIAIYKGNTVIMTERWNWIVMFKNLSWRLVVNNNQWKKEIRPKRYVIKFLLIDKNTVSQ